MVSSTRPRTIYAGTRTLLLLTRSTHAHYTWDALYIHAQLLHLTVYLKKAERNMWTIERFGSHPLIVRGIGVSRDIIGVSIAPLHLTVTFITSHHLIFYILRRLKSIELKPYRLHPFHQCCFTLGPCEASDSEPNQRAGCTFPVGKRNIGRDFRSLERGRCFGFLW